MRWKTRVPGEGFSSPIVSASRVFVTSAFDDGERRAVHCLDRSSGKLLWSREIEDDDPELASSMTGHAASTPVTDGERVVAFFGNAGIVAYHHTGRKLWHRDLGQFESELGIASSPILVDGRVILLCDHDGSRFSSFDSFLIALDVASGRVVWKTERPELYRSWSTPIVVPGPAHRRELIVNAQDEVRAYDVATGKWLWRVKGMTGWVTPSPVFDGVVVFATSGKKGPIVAVRPGGRGEADARVVWTHAAAGPYVCSPLHYRGCLYAQHEQGVLACYDAGSGELHYRRRLEGKFTASPVAGDGKVFTTNQRGTTFVLRGGPEFEELARNKLEGYCLASPAFAGRELFIRVEDVLYCIRPS